MIVFWKIFQLHVMYPNIIGNALDAQSFNQAVLPLETGIGQVTHSPFYRIQVNFAISCLLDFITQRIYGTPSFFDPSQSPQQSVHFINGKI